jgi:lactate dehydrogenase-like 2-hydroxyacid dehydrogenase
VTHVYLSRELTPGAMTAARSLGLPLVVHDDPDRPPSRDRLLSDVRGASALITLLTERVDAELLDAAGPNLRIVANCAVGYDNVSLDAAAARGVIVTNTPGVLDEATADVAFGLVLAASRRLVEADRFMRTGADWIWGPQFFVGLDISAGATLGIVGLGRIGLAVARRAAAFNMRILATGRRASSDEARALGVQPADLPQLLGESDVVSLHCPLTPETHHLIGPEQLTSMQPTAILVNTARGPVVDEAALVEALRSGHVARAGLDVFTVEPLPADHPLAALPNVTLSAHSAFRTPEASDNLIGAALDHCRRIAAG